jgi:hypothetical protein
MEYKLGENFELRNLFINVFRDYSSENAQEEKNTAILAIFNNIKEYGMLFVDCFSLEYLLSAGNLFDKGVEYNNVTELSDIISKLYLGGENRRASLMVIIMLKLVENPDRLHIVQNIFERIENIRVDGISLISLLLSVCMESLSRVNKDKTNMVERVAKIYNSAPKTQRINVYNFNIWPKLSSSETRLFEIPDHDISGYEKTDTDEPDKYDDMSQDCSQKVHEIKEIIRTGQPWPVTSAVVNDLEKCRPDVIKSKTKINKVETGLENMNDFSSVKESEKDDMKKGDMKQGDISIESKDKKSLDTSDPSSERDIMITDTEKATDKETSMDKEKSTDKEKSINTTPGMPVKTDEALPGGPLPGMPVKTDEALPGEALPGGPLPDKPLSGEPLPGMPVKKDEALPGATPSPVSEDPLSDDISSKSQPGNVSPASPDESSTSTTPDIKTQTSSPPQSPQSPQSPPPEQSRVEGTAILDSSGPGPNSVIPPSATPLSSAQSLTSNQPSVIPSQPGPPASRLAQSDVSYGKKRAPEPVPEPAPESLRLSLASNRSTTTPRTPRRQSYVPGTPGLPPRQSYVRGTPISNPPARQGALSAIQEYGSNNSTIPGS